MASLQSQLKLSVVKKSDVLSAILLSMYKSRGRTPSAMGFGERLALNVSGNVASNVLGPDKPIAKALSDYLSGDETCSALAYGLNASFRKGRSLNGALMESAEYLVSEKLAKWILTSTGMSNELTQY